MKVYICEYTRALKEGGNSHVGAGNNAQSGSFRQITDNAHEDNHIMCVSKHRKRQDLGS